jgi:hypothetical protein
MKLIFLILLSVISLSSVANTGEYLISEMEDLRNSLKPDDPAKIDLTLRLADLYFDVSIKEEGKTATKENRSIQRKRALSLYTSSLEGADKASGLTEAKIIFQMGRLHSRLDEFKTAESYYIKVFTHADATKKLKEQSALALAEWYEEDAKFSNANKYYEEAKSRCESIETCNYIYYRRSWLLYKDTKLTESIEEIKKSLWNTDGSVRENSLTDMIMFMSNAEGNGDKEYKFISELATKINRPKLETNLTEAFYASGNRMAGSNLLMKLNNKTPELFNEIRLLEEFYGFRNWDNVEVFLSKLEARKVKALPADKNKREEMQTIIRRYIVQIDAESQVANDLYPFLKRSIDVYLSLYPNDELRKNMQQGWLKAEDSKKVKVERLGTWIAEDISFKKDKKDIRELRQTRLAFAQELNMDKIVLSESLALRDLLKGSDEADEFTYIAAREYYGKKDFKKSLPLFNELTNKVLETKVLNKWAMLSQNLTLDIYNQQKSFGLLMKQVSLWKSIEGLDKPKKYDEDFKNFDRVFIQAEFENAAKLGETPAGLATFFKFCFDNVYPEKSCPNAKVLAVKLKDQQKLVSLLEKEKDEKALVTEYELMGRFSDAAKLQEKLNLKKDSDFQVYLKIALLYELDQDFVNRDRLLSKVIAKFKRTKGIDPQMETLIFVTLDEAGLINSNSLVLPWSLSRKVTLANKFQTLSGSKLTSKFILSQKQSTGPQWSKLVLEKVQAEYKKPSRINFYGRNSKWKFKKRVKAMDKFAIMAKSYLEGSDSETRIYILQMLKTTYDIMAIELQSTPLPEGLDEETLGRVMNQLADMAQPYSTVAADYDRLLTEELATATNKDLVVKNLESGNEDFASFIKSNEYEAKENLKNFDYVAYKTSQNKLGERPEDINIITNMEKFYKENNSMRLASYFTGRKPVNVSVQK